jgi:aryl-alcohol dehydrogenase (NADP+)
MEMRKLPGTEIEVSKICLGTMTFGEQNTESEAHEQLDYATKEGGINFIDTAELYPVPAAEPTATRTESYIGSWIKNQKRDELVIASKVIAFSSGLGWFRNGPKPTKEHFKRALDDSLKRLGTDYLDLYQIHWPSRNTPLFGGNVFNPDHERDGLNLLEQADAMNDFIKEGKIRSWGLSNEKCWGVMKFVAECEKNGFAKPVSIQNAYNLINRSFEESLSETCFRENIGLLPYSPLAFGYLTGKYLDNPKVSGRINLFEGFDYRYGKPNTQPAIKAYVDLAKEVGLSPTHMALAFVNDRNFVTSNIIGATNLTQLKENIESANIKLDKEVLKRINQIHLKFPNPAP